MFVPAVTAANKRGPCWPAGRVGPRGRPPLSARLSPHRSLRSVHHAEPGGCLKNSRQTPSPLFHPSPSALFLEQRPTGRLSVLPAAHLAPRPGRGGFPAPEPRRLCLPREARPRASGRLLPPPRYDGGRPSVTQTLRCLPSRSGSASRRRPLLSAFPPDAGSRDASPLHTRHPRSPQKRHRTY